MTGCAGERRWGAVLTLGILTAWVVGAGCGFAGGAEAPGAALAYIGPGAGLSAIGAFLALVAGVAIAVFGFVWYPVKRLLRALRRDEEVPEGSGEEA